MLKKYTKSYTIRSLGVPLGRYALTATVSHSAGCSNMVGTDPFTFAPFTARGEGASQYEAAVALGNAICAALPQSVGPFVVGVWSGPGHLATTIVNRPHAIISSNTVWGVLYDRYLGDNYVYPTTPVANVSVCITNQAWVTPTAQVAIDSTETLS